MPKRRTVSRDNFSVTTTKNFFGEIFFRRGGFTVKNVFLCHRTKVLKAGRQAGRKNRELKINGGFIQFLNSSGDKKKRGNGAN